MIKLLSFSLLLLASLLLPTANYQLLTYGQTTDDLILNVATPGAVEVGRSVISPISPLYFLKTIRERIEVLFAGTNETKLNRELEFSIRRIREMNSLINSQKLDQIPITLERYNKHIKQAEGFAGSDEGLKVRIGEQLARHLDVLQRAYDLVGDPRAKMAILTAIERIEEHNRVLLDKLSIENQQRLIRGIAGRQAFACRLLIRESSGSGLNDVEASVLKQKANECRQGIDKHLKDELIEMRKKHSSPSATY